MRAILASAVILVSAGAWAQSAQNSAVVGPDNGFFRPTPGNDPSLTNPRVPVPENTQPYLGVQAPMMVQLPRQGAVPVTVPVAQPVPNTEQQVVEQADAQTTQAENDAQVAAARAAAANPTR